MSQPMATQKANEAVDRVFVARLADLPQNEPVVAYADDVELVAVHMADGVQLFEGKCPHRGALLGEGSLEQSTLVCRSHGWRFNIVSGERVDDPSTCLRHFTAISSRQVSTCSMTRCSALRISVGLISISSEYALCGRAPWRSCRVCSPC